MLTAFLFVCVTFYLAYRALRFHQFAQTFAHLPGPPASIFTFGNAAQFPLDRTPKDKLKTAEFMRKLYEFKSQYSQDGIFTLWLGTNAMVIICEPNTAESILSNNVETEKSNNYDIFLPWLKRGLLTSYGDRWKNRRRLLTPSFHFNILNTFVPIFNKQAHVLVEMLGAKADEGVSFDLYPFVGRCALDVICETAMGVQVNAQRIKKSDYISAVKKLGEIVVVYERSPWLWFKPFFYLSGYGNQWDDSLNTVLGFTRKVIEERIAEHKSKTSSAAQVNQRGDDFDEFGGSKKRRAFLDLLIEESAANSLSLNDIQEEVDTFMFAGHDTTASAVSWTLYTLGRHPEIQETLYEEIVMFTKPDEDVSAEDVREMKYLEAVVREILRLFPPVPFLGRKVKGDTCTIGKWQIPHGAILLTLPYLVHRSESVYGSDHLDFRPERMLSQDRAQHPYAFIPFSAGPRNCIGQKFALLEEKITLATVLRYFHVTSLQPTRNVYAVPDVVTRPPYELIVRLERR